MKPSAIKYEKKKTGFDQAVTVFYLTEEIETQVFSLTSQKV